MMILYCIAQHLRLMMFRDIDASTLWSWIGESVYDGDGMVLRMFAWGCYMPVSVCAFVSGVGAANSEQEFPTKHAFQIIRNRLQTNSSTSNWPTTTLHSAASRAKLEKPLCRIESEKPQPPHLWPKIKRTSATANTLTTGTPHRSVRRRRRRHWRTHLDWFH